MNTATPVNPLEISRLRKTAARVEGERARELAALRARPDHLSGYDYFLDLLAGGVSLAALERRTGRPALNLLCVQAPLELIHAAGFLPFKIFSGSFAADNLGAGGTLSDLPALPALMCPMLRAVRGALRLNADSDESYNRPWVVPTTCDWIVKLPELLGWGDVAARPGWHWLELPHLKDSAAGRERWLAEIFNLKAFLEQAAGEKIDRKRLARSVAVYHRAWQALTRLEERRLEGEVPLPWFLVITNAFFLDAPETWTAAVNALLLELTAATPAKADADPARGRVFLAGSPLFFPNFKLPRLLEEAGLIVVGDDLCSSGRLLPGGAMPAETATADLLAALAARYHEGCLCPTFAGNDRRVNNILGRAAQFAGVVFHVLKGCHPYDLESCLLEEPLRRRGLKFLRLETDYAAEDSRNLLTRLEAFRQTL